MTVQDTKRKRFRLDGKHAVITGGAGGIGRAIAEVLAENGAIVHILDVHGEQGDAAAVAINGSGGQAFAYHCDVSSQSSVQGAFQNVFQRGLVSILVNNAGVANVGNLENTADGDFDRIFQVNVKSVFYCSQAAIKEMKKTGGVILNMASIAASAGLADRFAYSMSKGAVRAMTYSIAKDYLSSKIRCNCISPARVHTPFVDGFVKKNYPGREEEIYGVLAKAQPLGRMADPKEVADLALYLCSDEAAFITGTDYPIDGGYFSLRG
ncbi:MAG TPA: SDR family oxidoreductase [Candidatus Saccharimonadales bacterium]|nr:SDR family oxidoreductase [Candidatus Saccharimonadales bacterium]